MYVHSLVRLYFKVAWTSLHADTFKWSGYANKELIQNKRVNSNIVYLVQHSANVNISWFKKET